MDALIQLLLTTEEIEFMVLDGMYLDTKIELITLITLVLCYLIYKWGIAEDDGDEGNSKKEKHRK